ncbi:MAG TPA: hypothetical protein VMW19_05490 [Myxococcota bacterium]|nr:hypothetical protein [Myxococcota bacterium]
MTFRILLRPVHPRLQRPILPDSRLPAAFGPAGRPSRSRVVAARLAAGHATAVCVLTDGSGRDGDSRLDATTRLLELADAQSGPLYGRHPDRVIYDPLLDGDTSFFFALALELA